MKRTIALLLALVLTLGLVCTPVTVRAEETVSAEDCIKELILYYKNYQEAAETDIQRVLEKLASVDAEQAEAWTQIMDYWSYVNTDMVVNTGVAPDGLTDDDSMAIVILGYALNADGTMKDELIGRLTVGLDSANKYPNAYVVVTGGGTAADNPDVTEGGAMGAWLLENGLDEDRLIIEDAAPNTVGNAENTYKILSEQYPQVKSLVMVTSDYHVPRGCILFYSKCLLAAYESGGEPLELVSNAGYLSGHSGYESISLQASGVASVAGVSASGTVTLSSLVSLTAAYDGTGLTVTAGYDSDYSRDVTAAAAIEGYDPALGAEQTVAVSYTENGITIELDFDLSAGEKSAFSTAHLEALIAEAQEMLGGRYTAESQAALEQAIADAQAVLEQEDLTLADIDGAYAALTAAIDGLVLLQNVAAGMTVTANCNQSNAYKITDSSVSTYWESKESGANVPTEDSELVIDLDGEFDLAEIVVVPYYSGSNKRYYDYDVSVSLDGENWTLVGEARHVESLTPVTSAGDSFVPQQTVRYIKVEGVETLIENRSDINNIHICEIYAYGQEVGNLALNKSVTSSGSDQSAASSAGASENKVNDGSRSTYWDGGKYSGSPWVIIDLEDVYLIDTVNVISYYSRNDRYYNYEVYASPDGEVYELVASKTTTDYETILGNTFDLTGQEVYARYIKVVGVYNSKNSAYHINEVRVYGQEVDYELILARRELNALIEGASAYAEEDYTILSWMAYRRALEKAQAVAADETAGIEAVERAIFQLTKAEENLRLRPADYCAVLKAIARACRLDPRQYENFDAVAEAICAVEWDKDFTEQEEVDAMAQAIEDAIDSLVEKQKPPRKPGHGHHR